MVSKLDVELGALLTPDMVDLLLQQRYQSLKVRAEEGQPKPIFLLEDDADAFELFVTWLYRGTVSPARKFDDQSNTFKLVARYLRLYMFADTIGVRELKNIVLDRIQECCLLNNTVPGKQDVKRIYGSTLEGSLLRRFTIKSVAWKLQQFGEWFDHKPSMTEAIREYPDFAMDLISLLQSRELIPDPRRPSECEYHDHAVGELCSSSNEAVDSALGSS
ncbi:MAG: hypothetical protein M1812_003017 [Candelaria pacifica]|nr:MAG: hypothetical protein M1812_003017 [Candelaria pacifica]